MLLKASLACVLIPLLSLTNGNPEAIEPIEHLLTTMSPEYCVEDGNWNPIPDCICNYTGWMQDHDPNLYDYAIEHGWNSESEFREFFELFVDFHRIDARDYAESWREFLSEEYLQSLGLHPIHDLSRIMWFAGNVAGAIGEECLNILIQDYLNSSMWDGQLEQLYWHGLRTALKFDSVLSLTCVTAVFEQIENYNTINDERIHSFFLIVPYSEVRALGDENAEYTLARYSYALRHVILRTDKTMFLTRISAAKHLGRLGSLDNKRFLLDLLSDKSLPDEDRIAGLIGLSNSLPYPGTFDHSSQSLPFEESLWFDNVGFPIIKGSHYEIDYLSHLLSAIEDPIRQHAILEYLVESSDYLRRVTDVAPWLYMIIDNREIIRDSSYRDAFVTAINEVAWRWSDNEMIWDNAIRALDSLEG